MPVKVSDLLLQMRNEQREDHNTLVTTVTDGFSAATRAMAAHTLDDQQKFSEINRRLDPLVQLRKTLIWAAGTIVVAVLPVVADACYHMYRWRLER